KMSLAGSGKACDRRLRLLESRQADWRGEVIAAIRGGLVAIGNIFVLVSCENRVLHSEQIESTDDVGLIEDRTPVMKEIESITIHLVHRWEVGIEIRILRNEVLIVGAPMKKAVAELPVA